MRVIGLDVHRSFGQIAILEAGKIRDAGRVAMEREAMLRFARTLTAHDEVVLEETGNTAVLVRLLTPFVRRVVVANPLQVRAIAGTALYHALGALPEPKFTHRFC